MVDTVFVQPHFDDVALSCGGTVARLAASAAPLIVTVCGGTPADDLSPFARMQHERWTLSDSEVVQRREEEDRCAARALGDSVRTMSLDYPDAIYRRLEYGSEEALFGALVDEDMALVPQLVDRIAGLGDRFVFPLAVGSHVDHQLTFLAGRALAEIGREVLLYADLPYALDLDVFEARLAQPGISEACTVVLDAREFERRWSAIDCYRSQLPVLFRSIPDPRQRFESFGRGGDAGPPVERFWRFDADEEARE